jgi:glycosyltransferase involved in cell wall biosynthesis
VQRAANTAVPQNGRTASPAKKKKPGTKKKIKKMLPPSLRRSTRQLLSPISPYPLGPYLYSRKMSNVVERALSSKGPFDVLLLRTNQGDLRVQAQMCRQAGMPIVVAAGGPLAYQADHVFRRKMSQTERAHEQFLYERADAITVISEDMKRMLVDSGIDAEKIFPIPNGIDFGNFAPDLGNGAAMRRELGLENCRVVGYVGGYWLGHDVACLLRAWQQVEQQVDDGALLLVGAGPLKEAAQALSVELGLNRCVWVGHVEHTAVPDYMAAMDVAVGPYVAEALAYVSPLKVIEYMAMGLPVVATAGGQIQELIEAGVSGFTYDPGNDGLLAEHLHKLLTTPDLIETVGRNARQRILSWRSWDDVAQDVLMICEHVVKEYEAA